MISIFKNLLRFLFHGPGRGLSWYMLHGCLKRMYILLLLDKMFYKYLLEPVGQWCC